MKNYQQIIKDLGNIYPRYLILLVLLPIAIGYFIDSDLVNSRYIIINLAWLPLFTISAILLRKRFIFQIANFIYFIAGFIEICHWTIIKGPISLTSILVIFNTNLEESIDFFNLKATYGLLILIPYTIVYFLSIRQSTPNLESKIKTYILSIVLLFAAIFIGENALHGRLVRKGVPQLVKVTFTFIDKIKLYNEAMQEISPKVVDSKSLCVSKSQTFILILGESCNRNHMSLYAYDRKTTPILRNRNDIKVFDDVVSPYSNTLNSVLSMLSESNLENGIDIKNSIDVIDVFHSAGFKTYWISNQSPIGIWDNLVTVFANKSDYKRFVNISSNTSFEAILTSSDDAKLFKPFSSVIKNNVKKKFIVLHLMGSHSSYSKRYPNEYNVFTGNDSKKKIIAEYDNSILYNDFIVDSLLKIIKKNISHKNNNISSAIYLSDHGENVFDELDRVGHDYSKTLPKANVEIPFIVWLSESYMIKYPEKVKIIESNIHKPFVSDDLFHSILDLNFIESPIFDGRRSLFSKSFDETRKRILEDKKDYDLK
ncbi:MAG: phosphoethanolamine transferase [Bacteroidales bacterium]|jgi:heptose-I-phosphate ethanolaminephosphotransferase|nr:phosphoethanolamine transferase [Bacteroidales bacterium]